MSHCEPTSRALSNLVIAKEQKLRSHVWRSSHRTLGKGLPATNAAGTEVSDLHLNPKKLDTNLCIRLDRFFEDLFFVRLGLVELAIIQFLQRLGAVAWGGPIHTNPKNRPVNTSTLPQLRMLSWMLMRFAFY